MDFVYKSVIVIFNMLLFENKTMEQFTSGTEICTYHMDREPGAMPVGDDVPLEVKEVIDNNKYR